MAADSTGTIGETPGPSTSMENTPPTYDEVFPALPESFPKSSSDKVEMNGGSTIPVNSLKIKSITTVTKLKPSQVTQFYVVSPEERRFKENNVFRERDQHKICAEIMQETNTRIEMNNSKDGKLTFLISGREDTVTLAKKKIAEALQTKGEKSVIIPKEHHKFVLGKNGLKLKDLEERTGTRITVPRQDDSSEAIKILGTKDAIDRAMHEILSVSHEAVSKASEKIRIPKFLHPFIRGPFDETVNQISAETGARIAIPPQESKDPTDDTINIMGDPTAIAAAKAKIMKLYEEKKVKCTSVPMQVKKAQHKYIIGRGGQTQREIFKQTGVYVDIPRQDDDTDTVTLWGEPEKIGPALSVLWDKAHSEGEDVIETAAWVHRHILGTKGTNFQEMNASFPNIRVTFENDGIIRMRGPRNDLPNARQILEDAIAAILSRISCVKLQIEPKYHRFIIGQKGKQITQIREESKAQVYIPDESDHSASSDIIRIEGPPEAVLKAQEMLTAIIDKQKERENEVTKELAIEQRFHRHFIGTKGEEIKKIRDMFNQVAINFPDPSSKSDKVTIRGSKNDVEMCYKYLAQETQNLLANNYRLEVPISNAFFKLFTSKERVKIQQMGKETNTRIDLPSNQQESKQPTSLLPIILSGKRDDVEKAKEMFIKLQKELGNHVQIDIFIPAKFHNSLIGKKGSLIRSISEECGGVTINFPPENSGSEKVSIIGPKDMVVKAKQQLLELKNEKVENSYEVEIKAKPELHRFLIGKKGTNINKLRSKTGVRIMFPADGDDIQDGTITIVGKKDGVLKAKAELEEMIHDLEKIVEDTVRIPLQYQSHFKRLSAQRQIKDGLGDLQITFPKSNNSDVFTIRGSKDCVEMAKTRITEMVGDLEAQVTMEVVIPQIYHRNIMGKQGKNVQSIQSEHKVEIQFPKRDTGDSKENVIINGNADGVGETAIQDESHEIQSSDNIVQGKPKESDIIILKGRRENCESAKAALLESIPVTKEVEVPFSFHKFIIGQKGANIREMKEKFDVDISVPPSEKQKDSIQVKGTRPNVERAIDAINEKVQKLREEQQERDAKNFRLEIQVDPAHHPKIIGKQGKVVSKIRKQFEVQIQFPEKKDDASDIISIIGYEQNTEAAKSAILDIVRKLENTVSEEVEIDAKVHRRIIGAKGRNINYIMNMFKVEVKFPKENSSNPNLVTISGEPENIERATEHLLSLQDDLLDDVEEQYRPPRQPKDEAEYTPRTDSGRGFYVKGAPWEQSQSIPDTTNAEEFPSMLGSGDGGSDEASESPKSRGWGLSSNRVAASLLQN